MRTALLTVLLVSIVAGPSVARANDRLPDRWRAGYGIALREIRSYMRYVLPRVWYGRIRKLGSVSKSQARRLVLAQRTADEIAHLLLPEARRIAGDALFGAATTHLRFLRPELREKAYQSTLAALRAHRAGARTLHDALGRGTKLRNQALDDRLEQALAEDLTNDAQELVETAMGLPLRGSPRGRFRGLPEKWESAYGRVSRPEVHRFTYWWLRKRQRLPLTHMAQTMSRPQIDRARNEGPVWGMTSGVSQDAWAQNRLRIDFRWGRYNWQIDRRRIRRRIDQDLAEATWAMARMVKELTEPKTIQKLRQHLQRRLREELDRPETKPLAQQFPRTRDRLSPVLERVRKELDPLMNEAIARVPFPRDMGSRLRGIAREHGRRFMHEETRGMAQRALARAAGPHVASRRVRGRLSEIVARALSGFDPGRAIARQEIRRRARVEVEKRARSEVLEEVSDALRETGQSEFDPARSAPGKPAVAEKLYRDLRLGETVGREVDRQLGHRNNNAHPARGAR